MKENYAKKAIEQLLTRRPELQLISSLGLEEEVSEEAIFSKHYLHPEELDDFDGLPEELTIDQLMKLNQAHDDQLHWKLLPSSVTDAQLSQLEDTYQTKLPQALKDYLQSYALPLVFLYGKMQMDSESCGAFTYPDEEENEGRHMEEEETVANTQLELYRMLYGHEPDGIQDMSSILAGTGYFALGGYNDYYNLLLDSEDGKVMMVDHEYPMDSWGEVQQYGSPLFRSFDDLLRCYFIGDLFDYDCMAFGAEDPTEHSPSIMTSDELLKRTREIETLGKHEENAERLMELVQREKGKCKIAALKALAQLDYLPAATLWQELVKEKFLNEFILMPSCSDCVSDVIAPVLYDYYTSLFSLPPETALNDYMRQIELRTSISLMLGKGTGEMQKVYRLAADHGAWMRQIRQEPKNPWDNPSTWVFSTGNLRIWNSTPDELEKLFPAILTASILRSEDQRLMDLADQLYHQYGGCWLMPKFMAAILTKPTQQVFREYETFLKDDHLHVYLYNVFGLLNHDKGTYEARFSWGNGQPPTELYIKRTIALDEQWLFRLAKDPKKTKPMVTLQSHHRIAEKNQDYDEMLLALVPKALKDGPLKRAMSSYFTIRATFDAPDSGLYQEALKRFGTAKKSGLFSFFHPS